MVISRWCKRGGWTNTTDYIDPDNTCMDHKATPPPPKKKQQKTKTKNTHTKQANPPKDCIQTINIYACVSSHIICFQYLTASVTLSNNHNYFMTVQQSQLFYDCPTITIILWLSNNHSYFMTVQQLFYDCLTISYFMFNLHVHANINQLFFSCIFASLKKKKKKKIQINDANISNVWVGYAIKQRRL